MPDITSLQIADNIVLKSHDDTIHNVGTLRSKQHSNHELAHQVKDLINFSI